MIKVTSCEVRCKNERASKAGPDCLLGLSGFDSGSGFVQHKYGNLTRRGIRNGDKYGKMARVTEWYRLEGAKTCAGILYVRQKNTKNWSLTHLRLMTRLATLRTKAVMKCGILVIFPLVYMRDKQRSLTDSMEYEYREHAPVCMCTTYLPLYLVVVQVPSIKSI